MQSDSGIILPATRSAPATDSANAHGYKWVRIGLIVVVFLLLYQPNLFRLWQKTNFFTGDRNWYHSMTIPLIGIYYLMLHRDEIMATPVVPLLAGRFTLSRLYSALALLALGAVMYLVGPFVPSGESTISIGFMVKFAGLAVMGMSVLVLLLDWGLGILLAGLLLSAYGIFPGMNDFIWDTGMVITLFGVVLTLCGWKIMRIAWFPIVFLLCAIPWPPLVYSAIAMPLQKLGAQASVVILNLIGIDASFGGTKIFLPQYNGMGLRIADRPLNVAEACAGLLSLMSFISIAAAVAFLSSRPLWQKLVITASAIPIAIACNVIRVAGVAALDLHLGSAWSEGFSHQFTGMILLLPAFLMIMLVCWVVDHIFIEEADEPRRTVPGKPAGGAA